VTRCYTEGVKKVISFDLDGTLVHADFGNRVWLEGIPRKIAEKKGIRFSEAYAIVKKEYDSVGEENLLWYDIHYWLHRLGLATPPEELLVAYEGCIEAVPHAEEVLGELSSKYSLVIASNAARIFVEKEVDHAGLLRYFSRLVSATTDYGMVKKEERFFVRLCNELSVTPAEIVHVGDHAIFDVQIPRGIGIESYHYSGKQDNDGTTINDLRQLLELL
jgi:HAD superfamily hydrolase (TIGR01549 family)